MTKTEKVLLVLTAACLLLTVGLTESAPREAVTPSPVYRSAEATAAPADALWLDVTRSIDLNHAPARELEALPGIGETLAGRIAAYRQEHGPFTCVEELLLIEGISEATLDKLLSQAAVRGDENG